MFHGFTSGVLLVAWEWSSPKSGLNSLYVPVELRERLQLFSFELHPFPLDKPLLMSTDSKYEGIINPRGLADWFVCSIVATLVGWWGTAGGGTHSTLAWIQGNINGIALQ